MKSPRSLSPNGHAGLLKQVIDAAVEHNVPLSGENALQRYDQFAFDRIAESAFGHHARAGRLEQLTFLRMGDLMFDNCALPRVPHPSNC